jgi:hypothetical protein
MESSGKGTHYSALQDASPSSFPNLESVHPSSYPNPPHLDHDKQESESLTSPTPILKDHGIAEVEETGGGRGQRLLEDHGNLMNDGHGDGAASGGGDASLPGAVYNLANRYRYLFFSKSIN